MQRAPDWILIRNLGRVKYFNISYLLLVFVPIAADFGWIEIPVEIKFAYAASLCYAFAIAIYQFMCPKIIKDYEKEQEYLKDNYEILFKEYVDLKVEIILPNLNKLEDEVRQKIETLLLEQDAHPDDPAIGLKLSAIIDDIYPRAIQRILIWEFNEAMTRNKWAIWTSGILYCAGSAIILVLLIIKSFHVFVHS